MRNNILKATLPLIFQTIPSMILYIQSISGYTTTGTQRYYIIAVPWEKCIHPILSFIFVKPLRRKLLQTFFSNCLKTKKNCSTPVITIALNKSTTIFENNNTQYIQSINFLNTRRLSRSPLPTPKQKRSNVMLFKRKFKNISNKSILSLNSIKNT